MVTSCTLKYCNLTRKDGETNPRLEGEVCVPNDRFNPKRIDGRGFAVLDHKTAYGVAYGRGPVTNYVRAEGRREDHPKIDTVGEVAGILNCTFFPNAD